MKTVVTVLDERPGAKHPWPTHGTLGRIRTGGQCCLGQHGRACGVPFADMVGRAMPVDLKANGDVADWVCAWANLPDLPYAVQQQVLGELAKRLHPAPSVDIRPDSLAAAINDSVSAGIDQDKRDHAVACAVAALRILFRWAGEQNGERWLIRHLK